MALCFSRWVLFDAYDRNTVYKNLFEDLRKYYDFILLDCSPEAGIQNVQAYTAATNILIVTEPTLYSTDGIIDAIEIAQVAKIKTNSELNILGIVINKMNNWKDQFDCVEYIRNSFAKYVYVFDTIIPNRASVDRATSNAKSVIQYRSKDKASLAFQKLAEEVLSEVSHYG